MATYPSFNEPLIHILNLSVMYGIFPSELKLVKVIPLYKVNGSMVFSNYRPVFVLPVFPEILEGNMYNQLLSLINKRKLLYSYQFSFVKIERHVSLRPRAARLQFRFFDRFRNISRKSQLVLHSITNWYSSSIF